MFEDSLLVESIENAVSVEGGDSVLGISSIAVIFDLEEFVFGGRAVDEQDKAVSAGVHTHDLQVLAGPLWFLGRVDSEGWFFGAVAFFIIIQG